MPQVPDDEVAHIFMVVKSLSNSMLRSIDAQGTNVVVANGVTAGQRAQHFMVHLIPRKENDGVNFVLPQKTMEQKDIEAVGNKLIAALSGNVEKQEPSVVPKVPIHAKNIPNQSPVLQEAKKPAKKSSKDGLDLDDIAKFLGAK